jgi:hypothetical protein
MNHDIVTDSPFDSERVRSRRPALPMIAVCVGVVLLPWSRGPRSGILGEGRYALALALVGLLIYAIESLRHTDLRVWRTMSVPLAIGCLLIAVAALNGYGALGVLVTAIAAVAWLVSAARLT